MNCSLKAVSSVGDGSPIGIFLIDVADHGIVQKRSNCHQLAISYVWGGVCAFNLTKENFHSLQELGVLLLRFEDVMRLTEQIRESFLWVDSLRIVQDDTVHRDPQISHTNVIYPYAFATVVSISGQDADTCLLE